MANEVKEIKIDKQNAIIVQFTDPQEDMNKLITELLIWIQKNNLTQSNHLFARNYIENNTMTYDFGIPINETVKGNDKFKFIEIAEHIAVSATHKGSYIHIDKTVDKLHKYLEDNDLKLIDAPRYIYYNGPEQVPEEELITEIQFPIAKK